MRKQSNLSKNSADGQALVEMALTLLIFLLLIFGIMEFARLMYTYNTIIQFTRSAARWSVVNVASDGDTINKEKAKNIAVYGNPDISSGEPLLESLSKSMVEVHVQALETDSKGTPISQKVMVRITGYQFHFVVPIIPDITIPAFETSLYTESMGATS